MKTFNQFLNGAKIPSRFSDSTEATYFLEDIEEMINAKALTDWARASDAARELTKVREAFEAFIEKLDEF